MGNNMAYSLKEAAEAAGVGKPAILKSLKNGRISGYKNDKGQWEIDASELHRIYPVNRKEPQTSEQKEPPQESTENRYLEREIELLREQLRDIREDRDYWRQQATALLTDQRSQDRKGFWRWLLGRG